MLNNYILLYLREPINLERNKGRRSQWASVTWISIFPISKGFLLSNLQTPPGSALSATLTFRTAASSAETGANNDTFPSTGKPQPYPCCLPS